MFIKLQSKYFYSDIECTWTKHNVLSVNSFGHFNWQILKFDCLGNAFILLGLSLLLGFVGLFVCFTIYFYFKDFSSQLHPFTAIIAAAISNTCMCTPRHRKSDNMGQPKFQMGQCLSLSLKWTPKQPHDLFLEQLEQIALLFFNNDISARWDCRKKKKKRRQLPFDHFQTQF